MLVPLQLVLQHLVMARRIVPVKKNPAVTTAVNPERPPAATPAEDSM